MPRIDSKRQLQLESLRNAPLITPTDLGTAASQDIAGAMNAILADVFALYMKTKNFHWHMSGAHFRDYHPLLDEQAEQLYAMTDPIAERIRKTGGRALRSIGHLREFSVSKITTPSLSIRLTCSRSCARTTGVWRRVFGRRMTWSQNIAILPRRV
jgi:hypothetical protein